MMGAAEAATRGLPLKRLQPQRPSRDFSRVLEVA